MRQFQRLIADISEVGEWRKTRSGLVLSTFKADMSFDLREGFPVLTTKKMAFKAIVGELLWFLSGSDNLPELRKYQNKEEGAWTIWSDDHDRWAKKRMEDLDEDYFFDECLGDIYGVQWRNFNGVDQIKNLINLIKTDPWSRYLLVSAWNPETNENGNAALPPCHYSFQCYVGADEENPNKPKYLDLLWNQRSVDCILGLPFNIASYALLNHILSKITGLVPRYLHASLGDTHIYYDHGDAVKEIMRRDPYKLPMINLPDFSTLDQVLKMTAENFSLRDYAYHPAIKASLSVG